MASNEEVMQIKILEIGIYKGSKRVTNDYYIKHFQKQQKEMAHYFDKVMGRRVRYLTSDKNTLTMGIAATYDALRKSHLVGTDIDLIIFCSNLPEKIAPQSAMLLHKAIEGKAEALCFDLNANCSGVLAAIELARHQLLGNQSFKRALIVGCDWLNKLISPNNELCYGQYGDVATAIILEKGSSTSDIIDFTTCIKDAGMDNIAFPPKGFANVLTKEELSAEDFYVKWGKTNGNVAYELASWQIMTLLERQQMVIEDIGALCLSQFCLSKNREVEECIGIHHSKSIYVGDEYGYTGCTSVIVALYEGILTGKIKRGDYVILWAFGVGTQCIAMLIRY